MANMTSSETRTLSGAVLRSQSWPGLQCHEVVYEPRVRLTEHEHAQPFLALTLSGSFEETTGGAAFEYFPGTALYHGAREGHAVTLGSTAVRCFVVEMETSIIESCFGCPLPRSSPRPDGEVAALMAAMYRDFRVADSSAALSMQGLLLQLIAALSRCGAAGHDGRARFLQRLDEFLRANYRSQLTLGGIAAAVDVPAAKLSASFRACRGHSIADEQRRLRIEYACRRMHDDSVSLAEIAIECGFADQPHFSRAFRRVKGMTPARYRDLIR